MSDTPTPATPSIDHPSHPDHPHHSFWQAAVEAFKHFLSRAPEALPYVAKAGEIAVEVAGHASPQSLAILKGVETAAAIVTEIEKEKNAQPSEPAPSPSPSEPPTPPPTTP